MSSSSRERPRRSDGDATHKRKRYRFKSYLDADTQARNQFDMMRGAVANKIDEVAASFRDHKLEVHPRPHYTAVHPHEEARETNTYGQRRQRRPLWPWALGLLISGVLGFLLLTPGADHTPPPVNVSNESVPATEPAASSPAQPPVVSSMPLTSAPVKTHTTPVAPVSESPMPPKPAVTAPAPKKPVVASKPVSKSPAPAKRTKTEPRAEPRETPRAAPVERYTEDLDLGR